jgi:hypothetical protein
MVKCEVCGREWEPANTDQQAREEFERDYPGLDFKDVAILCDPCWQEFLPWLKAQSLNN